MGSLHNGASGVLFYVKKTRVKFGLSGTVLVPSKPGKQHFIVFAFHLSENKGSFHYQCLFSVQKNFLNVKSF